MLIWHPIPVRVLGPHLAFQEHFDILNVAQALFDGPVYSDFYHPQVQRWIHHERALYDRYSKSRGYLKEVNGVEMLDSYPCPPRESALIVYPQDSDEFVLRLWKFILERP